MASPLVFFLVFIIFPSLTHAANLSIISHPSNLTLPTGYKIESSPGARVGSIVTCNRIHIHGISRLQNWDKYAHALKIRVSASQKDASFRSQTVELCFHRNASVKVGMCRQNQWEKMGKSPWVKAESPFVDRILDVRMLPDPVRSIEVSTELEFLFHRLLFMVIGFVLMVSARGLSESVVFYYGSFMTVGIIIVILMVLFQGMKLLPTGRKSSLAIVLYSSLVGVATFLLNYLSGLVRSILLEIGISEDMHNPLGIFLLVCLFLAGAWFGYWGVHKLVLADDGSVDSEVAYFVEWAILIFSAVMILQSSLDTIMAAQALVFAIITTAVARINGKLKFLRRLFKNILSSINITRDRSAPTGYNSEYSYSCKKAWPELHRRRDKRFEATPFDSHVQGVTDTPEIESEQDAYYSTFHKTPDRKKFTKEKWEKFTKDSTREALKELVSSPDFNRWAVANAERITLTPPNVTTRQRKQGFFRWF